MPKIINKHTDVSFKMKVINCYNTKKYTKNELLTIFGISNGSLYKWLKQFSDGCLGVKNKRKEKLTGEMKCYIRAYVIRRVNFNYKN
jgi:transposase-like protein